jgi:hypothetical protein
VAAVTQAAWIRALLKTYIKASEGKGVVIGGLFGAPPGADAMTIPWNRSQQAALLIYLWNAIEKSIKKIKQGWPKKLREVDYKGKKVEGDAALKGPYTLLNNDQGISVVLNVTNDLLFLNSEKLKLKEWRLESDVTVAEALEDLAKGQKKIAEYLDEMADGISTFNWISSGAEDLLTEAERTLKLSFRGGSGYREFRRLLLKHLLGNKRLGTDAKIIYKELGFERLSP